MQFPIRVGLRRSRLSEYGLLGVTVAALGAALLLPDRRVGLLLAVWTLGLAGFAWRRLAPTHAQLRLERDGRLWAVSGLPGADVALAIEPGGVIHPWLTVFRVRTPAGRRDWVIVAPDSTDPDTLRRLRFFLRWRINPTGGPNGV